MRILIDIGNFYYDTDDASVKERLGLWKYRNINPLICKIKGHKMKTYTRRWSMNGYEETCDPYQECDRCIEGHILIA